MTRRNGGSTKRPRYGNRLVAVENTALRLAS